MLRNAKSFLYYTGTHISGSNNGMGRITIIGNDSEKGLGRFITNKFGGYFMNEMKERRRYKRLPINVKFEVNKLYKQDNVIIDNLTADISVVDISKSGLGFVTEADLPIGYYFDGVIGLDGKDFFRAVIKIVRMGTMNQKNTYGAEFVGLAPFLAKKVDDYELRIS